jgi:hypothetical protein
VHIERPATDARRRFDNPHRIGAAASGRLTVLRARNRPADGRDRLFFMLHLTPPTSALP